MIQVLVVDDEVTQFQSLAQNLECEGFCVEAVTSAKAAIERLETGTGCLDVAVVNLMMPQVNGLELSRAFCRHSPSTLVVLTGPYPLSDRQLTRTGCGAVGFLPKPFEARDLAAYVREKLAALRPTPLVPPAAPSVAY